MIERFNFYDLYGYLIPGLVLVVLVWLPFGIVLDFIPDAKVASVAAVLAGGYIIGHFMQSIASQAIASTVRDAEGNSSYPSVVLLNGSDSTFTNELKNEINSRVHTWFRLEVRANEEATREIARIRQDAFFLCRRVVNQTSSYSEQHQGLYSLMRGLIAASHSVPVLRLVGCFRRGKVLTLTCWRSRFSSRLWGLSLFCPQSRSLCSSRKNLQP